MPSAPPVEPPAPAPRHEIEAIVERALSEDLTPLGDLTSALLPGDARATAELVSRADGVLAGAACVDETFRQVDASVEVAWQARDGDRVHEGDVLATIDGPLASVLIGERTALNLVSHLSGVATSTAQFVDAVAAVGTGTRIWDTRKTTPGLRSLEKAAVRAGGGLNHRGNLSDWVMFKDNHLARVGIAESVARARSVWPGRTVHVEADSLDQVDEALLAGADAILLDNMSPDQVAAAIERRNERRPDCLLEASGGITLDTVTAFAATGVDLISVGAITNSAPVLDLGIDIRPVG
jgi:nicotinate-nucleotide pyrophosphorylase (carboxylating)